MVNNAFLLQIKLPKQRNFFLFTSYQSRRKIAHVLKLVLARHWKCTEQHEELWQSFISGLRQPAFQFLAAWMANAVFQGSFTYQSNQQQWNTRKTVVPPNIPTPRTKCMVSSAPVHLLDLLSLSVFLCQRPMEDSEEKDKILSGSLPYVAQGAYDYRWICGGYRACRGAMINLRLKTVQSSSHNISHI